MTACFQFLLHLPVTDLGNWILISFGELCAGFVLKHCNRKCLLGLSASEKDPITSPSTGWAPSTCVSILWLSTRQRGWTGRTASTGKKTLFSCCVRHLNWRHACWWTGGQTPYACIHTPKRKRKSQNKVSCHWEKQRKRPYDERQTDSLNKNWNLSAASFAVSSLSCCGVWLYILSLTSLKYHLLEIAKISIMFCSSSHQEVGLFPYSLNLSWPYEVLWPMEHGGNGVVWVLSLSLKSFAASSIALLGAPKRLPSEDTSSSILDVENHVAHLLC